jgi:hypothetical protein
MRTLSVINLLGTNALCSSINIIQNHPVYLYEFTNRSYILHCAKKLAEIEYETEDVFIFGMRTNTALSPIVAPEQHLESHELP